jgi:hypothetical protein
MGTRCRARFIGTRTVLCLVSISDAGLRLTRGAKIAYLGASISLHGSAHSCGNRCPHKADLLCDIKFASGAFAHPGLVCRIFGTRRRVQSKSNMAESEHRPSAPGRGATGKGPTDFGDMCTTSHASLPSTNARCRAGRGDAQKLPERRIGSP